VFDVETVWARIAQRVSRTDSAFRPAFAPVQGQLLGEGRPANRARIQLICSITEPPMTALASRPGYLIKSTRSFCLHSRATTVAVRTDGTSGSVSPLINSNGLWMGFRPGVFLVKNSLTYRLFSQPGFNISSAASSGPKLASQAWLMCWYSGIALSISISSTRNSGKTVLIPCARNTSLGVGPLSDAFKDVLRFRNS